MNSKISFSIITVCYNSVQTIERTINSVLRQDYECFEYILIDGGSKDGTLNIIQSFDDHRLNFISEKDKGVYDAMNKGLAMAKGDFVLFLGSDDILYNSGVLSKAAHLMKNAEDVVYYGDVIKKKKQNRYDGEFSKIKWGYENLCHQSVFYPHSIYKNHVYDLNYKLVADWVYNLNLLGEGVKFIYIDIIVSEYNDCDGVSSTKDDELFLRNRKKLVKEAVGIFPYYIGLIFKMYRRVFL